nr:E3 SUMO-protein ligase ZBED1-like [Misgurnus anguillicaudatus]
MIVAGAEAQFSPHITCFAHTLNLASQKGLGVDRASRLLGKVRKIVCYFHRSPIACHVLQEKQTLMDLPKHKLIQDIITRWNSSFEMLERFLEQQPAIMATLMSKDLRKGVTDVCTLSESDIANMDDIVQLMGPVKIATTLMCEEDQPTLSVIAPLQAKLLKHLQPCENDSTLVAEIKMVMTNDLSKRYKGTQDALNIASALDPRFKELPYLDKEDREQVYAKLIFEAEASHQVTLLSSFLCSFLFSPLICPLLNLICSLSSSKFLCVVSQSRNLNSSHILTSIDASNGKSGGRRGRLKHKAVRIR